jgi:FMN phosphatase YigB (HAD superfamily)
MNNKIILTDVDGVCLFWEEHFHKWMQQRGHNVVRKGIYDIHESYDFSKDRAEELVYEFNTSSYMIDVPPYLDAISGIGKLKENGYRFIAITSVGGDYNTDRLRKINLEDHFGKNTFLDVICIDGDKRAYLEPYKNSGLYWLEDLEKNAKLGLELGLKPLLIDHQYNKTCNINGITRVKNWAEICNIILTT